MNINLSNSKKITKCSAVIVAAGNSQRMGEDKTLMLLCGKPVIVRTIEIFQKCSLVDEVIVVTQANKIEYIADLCKSSHLDKVSKVICGGSTRAESSLAGVCEVKKNAKLIAIHDCARPLASGLLVAECIMAAKNEKAVIPAIMSTDTLKHINSNFYVNGRINRDEVVRVQTPQVFDADIIKGALTDAIKKKIPITDDSSAVERLGFKVKVINGESNNIKLTTMEDLLIAETIIGGKNN